MATSIEHESCVLVFGQIGWAVREAIDLTACDPPHKRRRSVCQQLPERFACACKVQEVYRVDVCGNLSPSPCVHQQTENTRRKFSRARKSTSRFNRHGSPASGFPRRCLLEVAIASGRRRRFLAEAGPQFPKACSTGGSPVTCPDAILFAADLVSTIVSS